MTLKILIGGTPAPAPPALEPVDPVVALKKIAEGVKEAESILNAQSLVIAGGSVETDLYINVGSGAGAHAKISFNIMPKP